MRPEAAPARADRSARDHRARNECCNSVDEARIVSCQQQRRLAAVRDPEQGDPLHIYLRPPVEPVERGAEVLEWDVLQPLGEAGRVEVPDHESRNAVRRKPFAQPGRPGPALLAADREHRLLMPRAGGDVERPDEAVVGDRFSQRRVRPEPPAAKEGRRRDRPRRGDRRQDEPPRRAPPGVVGERQGGGAAIEVRGPSASRPIDAPGQRRGTVEVEHALLVGAECRPRDEPMPRARSSAARASTPCSRRSPSNRMLTAGPRPTPPASPADAVLRVSRHRTPPLRRRGTGQRTESCAWSALSSSANCLNRPVHAIARRLLDVVGGAELRQDLLGDQVAGGRRVVHAVGQRASA